MSILTDHPAQDVCQSETLTARGEAAPSKGDRGKVPSQEIKVMVPAQEIKVMMPAEWVKAMFAAQEVKVMDPAQEVKLMVPSQEVKLFVPKQEISRQDGEPLGFKTKAGPAILIYKSDITKMKVDVIVNDANGSLYHNGGVARAIARAAGQQLVKDSDDYRTKHKYIPVSQCAPTRAGNLPCRQVLHAVGPMWRHMSEQEASELLMKTYVNILRFCYEKKVESVAIPAISSGIYGGTPKAVSKAIVRGCAERLNNTQQNWPLKEIHMVDILDPILSAIQRAFDDEFEAEHWLQPIQTTEVTDFISRSSTG